MSEYKYIPKQPQEASIYDGLWKVASNGATELSGFQSVEFFRKSGVDVGLLKQIWTISTPLATMNSNQFYNALRLITMVQNGDIPINKERLISCANTNYGPQSNFPKFANVKFPAPAPAPTPASVVVPPASTAGLPYAITSEEHVKYYNIFKGYDTNADGFLTGQEAVPILAQSGLDQLLLRAIWELADDDKDTQLSSKEFCVAFHLIICISKRGLPLPPSLPPALRTFLAAAPLVPGLAPVPAAAEHHYVTPPAAAVAVNFSVAAPVAAVDPYEATAAPVPERPPLIRVPSMNHGSKTPTSRKKAFSYESETATGSQSPHRAVEYLVSGLSDAEEVELTQAVTAIRDVSRRALQSGDRALESVTNSTSSLKLVLQRLAQERISLTGAVESVEQSAKASAEKLDATVEEVRVLTAQLVELRASLEEKRTSGTGVQEQLSEVAAEKQSLLASIAAVRSQIAQLSADISSVAVDVGNSEGKRAELDERLDALDSEKRRLQRDVAAMSEEVLALQTILSALQGDKEQRGNDLSKLKQQYNVSHAALQRERTAVETKEAEAEALRRQKQALETERRAAVDQISKAASAGVAAKPVDDFAPTVPVAATVPTPASAKSSPAPAAAAPAPAPAAAPATGPNPVPHPSLSASNTPRKQGQQQLHAHFPAEPVVAVLPAPQFPPSPVNKGRAAKTKGAKAANTTAATVAAAGTASNALHDKTPPTTPGADKKLSVAAPQAPSPIETFADDEFADRRLIRAPSMDPFAFGNSPSMKVAREKAAAAASGTTVANPFEANPFVSTEFASGFETNPFEDPAAFAGTTPVFDDKSTSEAAAGSARGFDDDFVSSSAQGTDGFGFSSFDKNPFDEPFASPPALAGESVDAFATFPVSFDAFGVSTPATEVNKNGSRDDFTASGSA